MTDENQNPRLEGKAARVMLASTGVRGSHDDCSYPEGSSEREEWMAGWYEMNDEYKKLPLWAHNSVRLEYLTYIQAVAGSNPAVPTCYKVCNGYNRLMEADTQPHPGWGIICCDCRYVFDDEDKHVDYPPAFPCKKMRYDRRIPIFGLLRFSDGSENCASFKKVRK